MKGSVKNIGQKGNENRELYNNNLKVVNHMEKNINIAASGSEPETLQNQYLATKIALENNQEPKPVIKPEKHWKNIITSKAFQRFHSKSMK